MVVFIGTVSGVLTILFLIWLRDRYGLFRTLKEKRPAYVMRDTFLDPAEQKLLPALERALKPGHQIFSKVALLDIMRVQHQGDREKEKRYKIGLEDEYVDFLICDRDFSFQRAILLDRFDFKRATQRDKENFIGLVLGSIGLPLTVFTRKENYELRRIKRALYPDPVIEDEAGLKELVDGAFKPQ